MELVAPWAPVVSVAVTVTVNVPVCRAVVPEIRPVEELIDRPLGRPVADHVKVWPAWESVAVIWRLTCVRRGVDWLPGLLTVTVLPLVVEQPGSWKEAILVFQLKLPLAGMYSLKYQNVQSSDGSTCIAV